MSNSIKNFCYNIKHFIYQKIVQKYCFQSLKSSLVWNILTKSYSLKIYVSFITVTLTFKNYELLYNLNKINNFSQLKLCFTFLFFDWSWRRSHIVIWGLSPCSAIAAYLLFGLSAIAEIPSTKINLKLILKLVSKVPAYLNILFSWQLHRNFDLKNHVYKKINYFWDQQKLPLLCLRFTSTQYVLLYLHRKCVM